MRSDKSKNLASVRYVCSLLLLAFFAALAGPVAARAESALQREYEIKAAYLYNFINYIDWPEDAFPAPGGTITIGIVGQSPFDAALEVLNGKQIKGRTVALKQITDTKELDQCQIVFINSSEKARLPELLEKLKDSRALTVSEIDGFAQQGGIINFISEHNKVRFEINPDAARRLGLNISSELLKLAKVVKS
ncbi:MAG TPA: YfiR family protein [Candidatus Angelobacter sp.]|nr:YfiR family protein [Candidatus Angelobacter sp.]